MVELLFHGAVGEVTGSMHCIKVEDQWVALDCGLFQGKRDESIAKNRSFPVPPSALRAVVLSHAHADHSGRLPALVQKGFDGTIFCTPATRDLCAIMLPDSAHIQEEDIFYLNKQRRKHGLPPAEPLYGSADAVAAIHQMQTVSYDRWFTVVPGLLACFVEAGHMLGSAGIHLAFAKRNGHTPSLYFSGDVGRPDKPILRDPAPFPDCDVILCESTYGNRVNESADDASRQLLEAVKRTYDRRGKVIIPSFSVGRTQTVTYYLGQFMEDGRLPRNPVFVDSPLATSATEVFRMHPECFDEEALELIRQRGDIWGSRCCTSIKDVEESKALHGRPGPFTILSSSGMCEAGRILHHLKNNIEDPKNTVILVGFQAANTLGRRLADGVKRVRLFHEEYDVRAEIVQIHGFSAHADQTDLLRQFQPLRSSNPKVYLIHGEPDASQTLQSKLRDNGFQNVQIPHVGQKVEIE